MILFLFITTLCAVGVLSSKGQSSNGGDGLTDEENNLQGSKEGINVDKLSDLFKGKSNDHKESSQAAIN